MLFFHFLIIRVMPQIDRLEMSNPYLNTDSENTHTYELNGIENTISHIEIKMLIDKAVEVRDSLKPVIDSLNGKGLLVNNIQEHYVNGEAALYLSDRLVKEGDNNRAAELVLQDKDYFIKALNDSVYYINE